jgi:predicted metal-dependent hydrolase
MDERVAHGIELFNSRQFFVCHEVLEEVWTPERDPRRRFLQSLIHMAVGMYHQERGNPEGAARQLRKGLRKLAENLPECEGIDTARLHADAARALEAIEQGRPPHEFQILPKRHGNVSGLAFATDEQ